MPTRRIPTGIEVYFEVHGEGEPVMLIPGTGLSAEVWKEPYQLPELAERFQVILHDPRGCGRSTAYEGIYTIEQMAADAFAVLNAAGVDSAHVVGHSMGGRIGLQMALDIPDRVRSLVMAASGSGPAGRADENCVPGLPFFLVDPLIELGFEEYLRHEICDTRTYFTDGFRADHPDRVQAFYERAWATHAKRSEYVRLCQARHNWEATHRLFDVTTPTLVVVGDNDTIGSNHHEQAQVLRRIPGSEYMELTGQSHGFFWEVPEQTNAWLAEWVSAHSA